MQQNFEAALAGNPQALASLPPRVSVFGASALPQHYLHLLESAARVLEVHLFALTPTPELTRNADSALFPPYVRKKGILISNCKDFGSQISPKS